MEICDAHNDFLTAVKEKQKRVEIVDNFVLSGVKILSCAVFTTEQHLTINDVKNFKNEIDFYNKKYNSTTRAKNNENLLNSNDDNLNSFENSVLNSKNANCLFLLSIEDIGFIKTKTDLLELIKLKPFSVTLTWNYNNQFAGGALDNGGLTKFGKWAVKELEANGILVDTAHLNKKSFWQFERITTKPIYCSHANLYELKKHKRNLTKAQLNAIVNTNGYLGLTVYEKFIANTKTSAQDIAKHFAHLVQNYNNSNFGLGTDFYGCNFCFCPVDVQNYLGFKHVNVGLRQLKIPPSIRHKLFAENFKNFVFKINSKNKLKK